MITSELIRAVSTSSILSDTCVGVFSSDNLPEIKRFPSFFIANTDPSYKSGEHWVLLYTPSYGRGEYFDSYGRPPKGVFAEYISEWVEPKWNRKQVQSALSSVCGAHCLFVAWHRGACSFETILACYGSDLETNDSFVEEFVGTTLRGGFTRPSACCQGCGPLIF